MKKIIAIIANKKVIKTELKPASGIGFGKNKPLRFKKKLSPAWKLFFALGKILKTAWYQKKSWSNKGIFLKNST